VLVHYLCSSSSRAVPAGRGASGEVAADAATRPQRASRAQQRRAYSPSGECGGAPRRRGASQQRLSHHLASASSLETELMSGGDEHSELHLPLVPGISLEDAAALPPLFAMQQAAEAAAAAAAVQRQQHLLQFEGMLQSRGSNGSGSGSASASVGGDPFGLPPAGAHMHRSHPGVLYTDQRVATQLAQQVTAWGAVGLLGAGGRQLELHCTATHIVRSTCACAQCWPNLRPSACLPACLPRAPPAVPAVSGSSPDAATAHQAGEL
jgi:hypothetical protein